MKSVLSVEPLTVFHAGFLLRSFWDIKKKFKTAQLKHFIISDEFTKAASAVTKELQKPILIIK
jgi:hypothetical protein